MTCDLPNCTWTKTTMMLMHKGKSVLPKITKFSFFHKLTGQSQSSYLFDAHFDSSCIHFSHAELCQPASTQWVRTLKLPWQVQVLLTHPPISTFARQLFFFFIQKIFAKREKIESKFISFLG